MQGNERRNARENFLERENREWKDLLRESLQKRGTCTRGCSPSDEYTFSWRKLSVVRLCLKRDGNGHTPGALVFVGDEWTLASERSSIQPRAPLSGVMKMKPTKGGAGNDGFLRKRR